MSENKIPVFTAESIPQSCMDNCKKLGDAITKDLGKIMKKEIEQKFKDFANLSIIYFYEKFPFKKMITSRNGSIYCDEEIFNFSITSEISIIDEFSRFSNDKLMEIYIIPNINKLVSEIEKIINDNRYNMGIYFQFLSKELPNISHVINKSGIILKTTLAPNFITGKHFFTYDCVISIIKLHKFDYGDHD